ncbi:MAG: transcriptional regulator NrdR [Acidimicrobiia bacterium]
MRCPFCEADDARVVDSRPAEGGAAVRRRRRCAACGNRFTTYERREPALVVRKRDGRAEPFSVDKVRAGLESALTDRPVPAEALDELVRRVEALAAGSGPEVTTEQIGRAVLEGLRQLDEVAYLRFASVYKEFQGARDFEREMAALEDGPG